MKIEKKQFAFKLDDVDATGIFTGYASTFGNVDLQDDVVRRGAFKKTIKESKGKVPILDSHHPVNLIGFNLEAKEDDRGLFVRGQLNLDVQAAKEKHALMKQAAEVGARMGLSIGFRIIKFENDRDNPHIRHLTEVQLLEYSVVTFPANPEANVTDVKGQADLIGHFLQNEIGMNEDQAAKAVHYCQSLLDESEPDPHSESRELEPLMHSVDHLINAFKGHSNGV